MDGCCNYAIESKMALHLWKVLDLHNIISTGLNLYGRYSSFHAAPERVNLLVRLTCHRFEQDKTA